jgi:hypothetical protein
MKRILLLLLFTGCVSRQEVEGNIWNMDRIPESLCKQYPFLRQYGAFREISCKGLDIKKYPECEGADSFDETIPYCSNRGGMMKAADGKVVEAWLKKLGKPK